jgi:dienelactone hydrolase
VPSANAATAIRVAPRPRPATALRRHPPYALGQRVLALVDRSRTIVLPSGVRESRPLVTIVRFPVHAAGPFPLIVFGHGFAVTPRPYTPLLQAWARAGFVVAAPVFPLENGNAPGGPDESDLVNQPRDMSFLITELLRRGASRSSFLRGMISPRAIAVSGQSDGGETALAAAYDERFLDPRIRVAVILSGARIPGIGSFTFPAVSPPLLATQGTDDTINPPSFTHDFFDAAPRPKFLLDLLGAPHLPPYTDEQPQLGIVERVSTAFLNHYLKHQPGTLTRMRVAGTVAGLATLQSYP